MALLQLTPEVLKAAKSKNAKYYGVNYDGATGVATFSVSVEIKAFGQEKSIRTECPVKLRVTNYSSFMSLTDNKVIDKSRITRIYFGDSLWGDLNHIKTFFKAIKKDSDVWFEAIIFNNNDNWAKADFTNHKLYGYIGDNRYLLESYVGPNNMASPVAYN